MDKIRKCLESFIEHKIHEEKNVKVRVQTYRMNIESMETPEMEIYLEAVLDVVHDLIKGSLKLEDEEREYKYDLL